MSGVIELFGEPTLPDRGGKWDAIVDRQWCPFLDRKCMKVRKSQPEVSIGTCSVFHGAAGRPLMICPFRLLERRQIFVDCLHLLSTHAPGNELHIVPEVRVPGGSVDYFLVSVRDEKVKDFVGVELQTLDTTGTVWPARQRFLRKAGVAGIEDDVPPYKTYGMNWKMTAKTILVQLHHKIRTFEAMNKHLTLVIQDSLLEYLRNNFQFSHFSDARLGDSMQIHSYRMSRKGERSYSLQLDSRSSTDSEGIAACLGLQAEANIDLERIVQVLETKISSHTRFSLGNDSVR